MLAYIGAMSGWSRGVGRWLDALIVRIVPGVPKAVKWNYGVEGRGWFPGMHGKWPIVAFMARHNSEELAFSSTPKD